MNRRRRSPARLLAPLALIAAAIAIFLVLTAGLGGGDDEGSGQPKGAGATSGSETDTTPARPRRKPRATYTVKAGDSLGSISEKTGVEVETLELLNPEVDSQSLVVGQKLKLRE